MLRIGRDPFHDRAARVHAILRRRWGFEAGALRRAPLPLQCSKQGARRAVRDVDRRSAGFAGLRLLRRRGPGPNACRDSRSALGGMDRAPPMIRAIAATPPR
jgi:hypothetical protein